MKDLVTGAEREMARPQDGTNRLKISGDGRWAYYRVMEGGPVRRQAIYRVDLTTGQQSRVHPDCGTPVHASHDGATVLFETGSSPTRLSMLDASRGQKHEFLRHGHHGVEAARLSPDGEWLAFQLNRGFDGAQLFTTRFRQGRAGDESTWLPVTDPGGFNLEPWWSPNGEYLYFLSDRDGHRCVWAQQLSAHEKRPAGPARPILHLHTARLTALTAIRRAPLYVGLSVAKDRLVLSLSEITSNVFVGEL
jgi:Tol biopolymer transport system component